MQVKGTGCREEAVSKLLIGEAVRRNWHHNLILHLSSASKPYSNRGDRILMKSYRTRLGSKPCFNPFMLAPSLPVSNPACVIS